MEFLIARGFNNTKKDTLKTSLLNHVTFKAEKDTHIHSDGDFFFFAHGPLLTTTENNSYIFDGNAFYKNTFLHTLLDNKAEHIESIFNALEAKAMNDVSGVFCTLQIDLKAKQFTLYCDPLSQYPIASWQSGSQYIVSNNALLIEEFLSVHGHPLERDPLCMLRNAFAVLNLSLTTPFKEVTFQPPRTVLKGGRKLVREQLFSWDYLCKPTNSYDECITEAAERLKNKCHALIEAMPDYYFLSDLTGGIDSRLILSALLATGHTDKVNFWCNTRYPHPDANVADHIINRYKLKQGTTLFNTINEPLTLEQRISRGLFRNRGARYKDWSGIGRGYFPKLVRLNGSFGEIGRSNVLTHLFQNPNESLDSGLSNKIIQHMQKVGSLDFITEKGKQAIATPIQDTILQMDNEDIPRGCMSDMLYIDGRGRYHFGHYFSVNSGLFISPCLIYDINIIWANVHLNSEEKTAGKAQFDLIQKLGGDELVTIPLADKRWSPSILPHGIKQKLENVDIITRDSPALSTHENTMKWKQGWPLSVEQQAIPKPKPKPIPEYAKGKFQAWAQIPELQQLAKELLKQTKDDATILEYIDKEKLQALIATPPETLQKDWTVWALENVVAGLMWATGKQDNTPIEEAFKGEYPQ